VSSRRAARRAAVEILYAADIRGEAPEVGEESDAFTHELVAGVLRNLTAIDATLGAASPGWSVSRMASVDRAILRVSTYELIFTPTPPAAIIDEAVTAAHELSTDESGTFVNGVLRGVFETRGGS